MKWNSSFKTAALKNFSTEKTVGILTVRICIACICSFELIIVADTGGGTPQNYEIMKLTPILKS